MFVRVNIEEGAWTNPGFAILANVLGFADAQHALIKCAVLWSWQTDNFTPERPTYVVDADTIDACLGRPNAGAALVRAKLAEEHPDGYRIKGSHGRIEWLWKCRQNARRGGESRRIQAGTPVGVKGEQDNKEDPPGLPPGNPPGKPMGNPSSALLFSESPTEKNDSPKAHRPKAPPGPAADLTAHWMRRFEQARGFKAKQPEVRRIVDGLLKRASAEVIRRHMDCAFDDPPNWPPPPHSIAVLERHFEAFDIGARAPPQKHPTRPADVIRPTKILSP